jgi:outer membrane protein assembly factor BamD
VDNRQFWNNGFFMLCFGLLLSGCASKTPVYEEKAIKDLYQKAKELMDKKSYENAANAFDEVERQHPYSDRTSQAQLLSAYCAFKAQKFPRAIASLDVFIELHPGSASIPYAYYLRALSYYNDMLGLTKDKQLAESALAAFKEVLSRFPTSEYAHDAKIKEEFISEHLACHSMLVAKSSLFDQRHVAAWIQFSRLMEQWPRSILMPEVLYRLVEVQLALGMIPAAHKTYAMLRYNFPKNIWTQRADPLIKRMKSDACAPAVCATPATKR